MSQWETLCVQITTVAENEIVKEKENFFSYLWNKSMQVIEQPWTSQSRVAAFAHLALAAL